MTKNICVNLTPYRQWLRSGIFYFLTFCSFFLTAQNVLETRWHFGNSAEYLVFDANGREVYLEDDQFTPFAANGGVTIIDQFTGNVLFYSDGQNVYDVSNTLVPGGAGLNGSAAVNVPAVVVPVQNNPGEYYIFTNSGTAIEYTTVDATLQGNGSIAFPYGQVTAVNQATGLTDPSSGMIVIPRGDGNTFWLLTQNRNTFEFSISQINNSGTITIQAPVGFANDTVPGFEASHFAYFIDSLDNTRIAVAPRRSNRNIWLLDFDEDNGTLSFDSLLVGTGVSDDAGEAIYDIEWSPDGSKLYYSRYGGTGVAGQLYQYDLNDTTGAPINPVLSAPLYRSLGLKKGPDDRIYHLYQSTNGSPFNLGRINLPDSVADSVQYQPIVFNEDFQASQFPEHTDGYDFEFDTLGFSFVEDCETNVTKFFPIANPTPNTLFWNLEDTSTSAWIPSHQFSEAGAYSVTLQATIGGITKPYSQLVEIRASELEVNLGNDTTICVDDLLTLDAGEGVSYVWSTGETTQSIVVDTTATFWVEVTDASGCTDFDDIEVTEYGVANQTSNQWYFGEQAGIEFTQGPLAILDGNRQDASEGCATVSDVNGDLLFYTNGVTVWNREHQVMVNGDEIGGDLSSAQNSIIMPFGNDQTLFYIFTTEQVYGDNEYELKYSVIDMKGDTARGEVLIKDVSLMDRSTERITASGFNGTDVILAHEFGNNMFRAFRTSAGGLGAPVFSPSGEVHDFMDSLSATGYMKISPTLNQIAVNIPGTGQVEIFDYSRGLISNPRLIDTGETDLYGMEFSPGGNRLYLTTSAPSSKLIQYDLDSLDSADPVADISATKYDTYTSGSDYGALQLGPNGIIYMAVDNSGTVGTISSPDGDDDAAGFDPGGFDLSGRTSRLGLPNFAQNQSPPLQQPSITIGVACAGLPTSFSAVGRDPNNQIENYLWIFGDGTTAAVQDTTHIYTNPGTYTVQMVLSNRCDTDTTLSQTITVNNIPENPTVPPDTALCGASIILEAWPVNNPDFIYYWSTGDTTRQITVTGPGIIDVALINRTTGCSSDTLQVFMADARPSIDLGEDRVVCENDTGEILDAGVSNATGFIWYIDGAAIGTNRTFQVRTDTDGTFEYVLEVTNSFGCFARDTIQVTVLPEPDITVSVTATTGCGNRDGSIDLTTAANESYSYRLTGPSSIGPLTFDGPGTITIPPPAPDPGYRAGNYTLTVTNQVTGCTLREVVQVEDPGSINLNVANTGNCENGVELTITGTTPSLPANYSYEVRNSSTVIVASSTNETADPLVISGLDPDTYFIEISDNAFPFCIETEEITVAPGDQPIFTFDAIQEICGTTGTVQIMDGGTAGVTYTWFTADGNITGGNPGSAITVDQPGTYTVSATAPGFCDRNEDILVNFNGDPVVNITLEGDLCEGEIRLVPNVTNGSGSYVYQWSDGSQSGQRVIRTSGTYAVTVTDQVTSCRATSASIDVDVQQEFMLDLSLEPDCENTGYVFAIATPSYYNPSVTYQWRSPNGTLLSEPDSILRILDAGRYTVTATNESGVCTATESIDVTVIPINDEDIRLPSRAAFCVADPNNPTVDLNPGVFNTYEWRLLPDDAIISTNQILNVGVAGAYEVTLYNGFTCRTARVEVVQDCRPTIFAPNAFSPNGNGINDEFFVFPNDFVDAFEILIYSRWGELVYRSTNQDFRWNGVYKGQILPPGSYAYVMNFSSSLAPELGTIEQFGSVTLVR